MNDNLEALLCFPLRSIWAVRIDVCQCVVSHGVELQTLYLILLQQSPYHPHQNLTKGMILWIKMLDTFFLWVGD